MQSWDRDLRKNGRDRRPGKVNSGCGVVPIRKRWVRLPYSPPIRRFNQRLNNRVVHQPFERVNIWPTFFATEEVQECTESFGSRGLAPGRE